MIHTYSFEKLDAWQEARLFVTWVYQVTSIFPSEEKFGLVMQLRRSSISIVSNLAEGSARTSLKDQAHFTQLAYSSTIEALNQLIIANDLKFLSLEQLKLGRVQIEKITTKISGLRKISDQKVQCAKL